MNKLCIDTSLGAVRHSGWSSNCRICTFEFLLGPVAKNSKSTYIILYGSGMDTALGAPERSAVVQPEIVLPVHAASAIGEPTYDIAAYTKIVWPPWGTLTVLVQTKVQTEEFRL